MILILCLVVITELDGLKGNAPPLGTVADKALRLIETTLASKQLRRDVIRIQTSHHNFMYDIAIRSEQFIFGETDKNLDDLILSTCLWWKNNKKLPESSSPVVPVCLVTADRNLSVKARARDVQVIPVSGLMEISSGSRHP
jgi:predicted ribonuclease YlaK